jgi:hypothetical protein
MEQIPPSAAHLAKKLNVFYGNKRFSSLLSSPKPATAPYLQTVQSNPYPSIRRLNVPSITITQAVSFLQSFDPKFYRPMYFSSLLCVPHTSPISSPLIRLPQSYLFEYKHKTWLSWAVITTSYCFPSPSPNIPLGKFLNILNTRPSLNMADQVTTG